MDNTRQTAGETAPKNDFLQQVGGLGALLAEMDSYYGGGTHPGVRLGEALDRMLWQTALNDDARPLFDKDELRDLKDLSRVLMGTYHLMYPNAEEE